MNSRLSLTVAFLIAAGTLGFAASVNPPPGFVALFNGKDLSGFRGGDTFDPRKLNAMSESDRAEKVAGWTKTMRAHWTVENGELVNDGEGAYATTEKDYGDFELLVEYRTVAKADSGIYLRGCPQVQIWDYTDRAKFNIGADKGSGGLWNNNPGTPGKDPLKKMDKPFGQWNAFRIVMVGSRVSVWLNGEQVVKNAIMQNYYDRKTPVPAKGPIQLQTHGGEIRWRNIFIKELTPAESAKWLKENSDDTAAYKSIFNGKDLTSWAGPTTACEVRDSSITWKAGQGGTIYVPEELTDFAVRLEFLVPPGGNNGLAIRYPGQGDTAYDGMCECQVLDEKYEEVKKTKLDPRQMHGSAYGMAAAVTGYQRPAGEWNYQEVTVKGSTIAVELNGTIILDADLSKITNFMGDRPHPGKERKSGYFGFAGHNDPVMFRNIELRKF